MRAELVGRHTVTALGGIGDEDPDGVMRVPLESVDVSACPFGVEPIGPPGAARSMNLATPHRTEHATDREIIEHLVNVSDERPESKPSQISSRELA